MRKLGITVFCLLAVVLLLMMSSASAVEYKTSKEYAKEKIVQFLKQYKGYSASNSTLQTIVEVIIGYFTMSLTFAAFVKLLTHLSLKESFMFSFFIVVPLYFLLHCVIRLALVDPSSN